MNSPGLLTLTATETAGSDMNFSKRCVISCCSWRAVLPVACMSPARGKVMQPSGLTSTSFLSPSSFHTEIFQHVFRTDLVIRSQIPETCVNASAGGRFIDLLLTSSRRCKSQCNTDHPVPQEDHSSPRSSYVIRFRGPLSVQA